MKTTRRSKLTSAQSTYAAAKAACDVAWAAYQAAVALSDDEASEAERSTWSAWAAAKAALRGAERAMVVDSMAKLRRHPLAREHAADLDMIVEKATGEYWDRVVEICFLAA